MMEDVGEADEDSKDQGAFDGLIMCVKDLKIYVMMLTFTAYVVGLSFNAFFVSEAFACNRDLLANLVTTANSYWYSGFRLRTNAAHVVPTMG
jgi:hypothetical protein